MTLASEAALEAVGHPNINDDGTIPANIDIARQN